MQPDQSTYYNGFIQMDPFLWNVGNVVFDVADTQTRAGNYAAESTTRESNELTYFRQAHYELQETAQPLPYQELPPVVQSDRGHLGGLPHQSSPGHQRMAENELLQTVQTQEHLTVDSVYNIEAITFASLDNELSWGLTSNRDSYNCFNEPDTHNETTMIPTPPASQSGNRSTKSKRSHKRVKHAQYRVPIKIVPQLPWKLQLDVKEMAIPNPMFINRFPYVWAETSEDLLYSLQTCPDIFEAGGIGTEGRCLNHLILSGQSWQDIEWINPYTFVLKRAWRFSNRSKRYLQTEATSKTLRARKKARLNDLNSLEDDPSSTGDFLTPFPGNGGEIAVDLQARFDSPSGAPKNDDVHQHYHTENEMGVQTIINTQNSSDEHHPLLISPESENSLPIPQDENIDLQSTPDEAILPQEAQLFLTAVQSRHPISIFSGSDLHLFGGNSPNFHWKYAFMGFFLVSNFEKDFRVSDNQDEGSSELRITFEWIGNGSICSHPHPWWVSPGCISESVLPKNVNDIDRAICSDLTCFSHISLYPKPNRDQSDASFDDVDDDVCIQADFPSCWLCRCCGKLNAVVPFRLHWSWICRHCKTVGRSLENVRFEPIIFQEAYHLPPPLPLEDPESPVEHQILFFKPGERAIVYLLKFSDIVLRHIPSTDEDSQTELESLYCNIQRNVDFEPCNTDSSLLKFHYSRNNANLAEGDGTFLTKVVDSVNSLMQDRPGLVDGSSSEPHDLRCFFWQNKGTTKPQLLLDQHVIFVALGSACELRLTIKRNNSDGKEESCRLTLDMPHCGILVFNHCEKTTVTYKVFRTGRLLLLTSCWNDIENPPLPDEIALSNQM